MNRSAKSLREAPREGGCELLYLMELFERCNYQLKFHEKGYEMAYNSSRSARVNKIFTSAFAASSALNTILSAQH